ncbi:DDE-type integrase/transposase/recombinase [Campylobacter pinnipediorum]|uniref:DDE-type integrase/transposase/recombinase n=1 Tax=Campylobacter pinnipediorum TaxID=1965231 RepID=UPI000994F5D5|nr:DDE-type integrase/transposase/recombinase [Campylobacter pinnipediorum]AQW80767.1 rve domain integrase [Campylobacter pinnipediorum subsp. pinnipediorum]AQW83347.1 rve domain integrase [Campylobacter pinnipediorum subsp. pinnipediorum]
MWVNSKQAADILGVSDRALQKSAKLSLKKCKKFCSVKHNILGFNYADGKGRGGKVLQIWIDDEMINKNNIERIDNDGVRENTGGWDSKDDEGARDKKAIRDFTLCGTDEKARICDNDNGQRGDWEKNEEYAGVDDCLVVQKASWALNKGSLSEGHLNEVDKKAKGYVNGAGRFASASEAKKELALTKKLIVNEWEKAKGKIKEADFIEYINAKKIYCIKLTANKLYAWQRAYKSAGIDGLVDERTNNKESELERIGLSELAVKLIHAQKGRVNSKNIHKVLNYHAINENKLSHMDFLAKKDEIVSYEVVNRFVNKYLKANPMLKTLIEKGEDGVISKHFAGLGVSNWAVSSINEIVEIDASPFDVICNASDLCEKIGFGAVNNVFESKDEFESFVKEWQKRYTLIGLIDTYSGVASFYISESENSTAIARATAKYISRYGKMKVIKGDNGKAFKSKANFSFLSAIGVKYEAVRAYSGWLKPYVEKNFGALQNGLSEWLRGYIGHSITQRQAIEFFMSKKERRLKKGYKTNLRNLKSLDEVSCLIDEYTEKFLNNRYLERLGKSAREAYDEKIDDAVGMNEFELSLYLAQRNSKSVCKKGVSCDGVWFSNVDMFNHSNVYVRANLNNINEQFVFDSNDKFIGVATPLDLEHGESVENAKAAQKIITQRVKRLKDRVVKDREEIEEFMVNYVKEVNASKALRPKQEAVNEYEQKAVIDRNNRTNAQFDKEYMKQERASKKSEIKGFEDMAKARKKVS